MGAEVFFRVFNTLKWPLEPVLTLHSRGENLNYHGNSIVPQKSGETRARRKKGIEGFAALRHYSLQRPHEPIPQRRKLRRRAAQQVRAGLRPPLTAPQDLLGCPGHLARMSPASKSAKATPRLPILQWLWLDLE